MLIKHGDKIVGNCLFSDSDPYQEIIDKLNDSGLETSEKLALIPFNDEGKLCISYLYSDFMNKLIIVGSDYYFYGSVGWSKITEKQLQGELNKALLPAYISFFTHAGFYDPLSHLSDKQHNYYEKILNNVGDISKNRGLVVRIHAEEVIKRGLSSLDSHNNLIGLKNGDIYDFDYQWVLDKTDYSEKYVTKRINIELPGDLSKAKEFKQFMLDITSDEKGNVDLELYEWFLTLLAYASSGDRSEQIWTLWYGTGANGKSLLIWVLNELLGDLITSVDTEMLCKRNRNPDAPSPALVALRDHRIVVANEVPKGKAVDEAFIKAVTGQDKIRARGLHQSGEAIEAKAFLIWTGNHMPKVSGNDHGFWRRVNVIPFRRTFKSDANKQQELQAAFKDELPHILALLGEYYDSRKSGYVSLKNLPECVRKANDEFRENANSFEQFKNEMLIYTGDTGDLIPVSVLCLKFREYLESNGASKEASSISCNKVFPNILKDNDINCKRLGAGNMVEGYVFADGSTDNYRIDTVHNIS